MGSRKESILAFLAKKNTVDKIQDYSSMIWVSSQLGSFGGLARLLTVATAALNVQVCWLGYGGIKHCLSLKRTKP